MTAKSSRSKRQKQAKKTADTTTTSNNTDAAAAAATSNNDNKPPESGSSTSLLNKLRTNMGINKLENLTIYDIFTSHPLIRVGKFVLLPYLLYFGYYFIRLQHPEYISKITGGIIKLRPAVHGTDTPRQVLIVATPGSGTVQMASELRSKLSLEIGHGSTDAAWEFTRDGTVSWLHGIRFLTEPKDNEEKVTSLVNICSADNIETDFYLMGFYPAMFGPPKNKCSSRNKWDECWKSECFLTLLREWGCATNNSCEINFARNVHQVRNPMNTLESLIVKYCTGDGLDGTVAEPFLRYASALFPHHNFYADSCIESTGTFMVMYLESMVEARRRGDIDAFYRIETSTACDVAEKAGLTESNTTVYGPNHVRVGHLCDMDNWTSPAQLRVEQKLNNINKFELRLAWNELRGGMHGSRRKDGDRTLEGRVRNLFAVFGYDEHMIPLEYKPGNAHDEF